MNHKLLIALLLVANASFASCPKDQQLPSIPKGIAYLKCGEVRNAIYTFSVYAPTDIEARYYLGKSHFAYYQDKAQSDAARKRHLEEAFQWTSIAADEGHKLAQYALARYYLYGLGSPVSELKAEHWYKKAANQGHIPAQVELATLYASAKGSSKVNDYVKGYAWMNIAAAGGNEDVKDLLEIIESRMSRKQIVEGQRLSVNLQKNINVQ